MSDHEFAAYLCAFLCVVSQLEVYCLRKAIRSLEAIIEIRQQQLTAATLGNSIVLEIDDDVDAYENFVFDDIEDAETFANGLLEVVRKAKP